jgi:hypothetical protein
MATGSLSLTSSWSTPSDWIDPEKIIVSVTGSGIVEFLWEIGTPAAAAAGMPMTAGIYEMEAPLRGYSCYFRLASGTVTFAYTRSSVTPVDSAKVGNAFSGDAGADEDFELTEYLQVGFDDLTTRTGANPYEFAAYYTTSATGLLSTDAVDVSYLMLRLGFWTEGRTLRVYGIKYATDQSSSITDWDTLQSRTKTTAYADKVLGVSDIITLEITAIINELKGVSGWDGDSPIQLFIEDTGSAVTDQNTLAVIDVARQSTQLVILLTSGSSPEPPDPGTGGP